MSLSVRRAWIEIWVCLMMTDLYEVALRKESVDRNEDNLDAEWDFKEVALRKESVDRNAKKLNSTARPAVALRKESVDRNDLYTGNMTLQLVALRKESVDRNIWPVAYDATNHASLSVRRAWIEILCRCRQVEIRPVALRKESVDRNSVAHPGCDIVSSRSP